MSNTASEIMVGASGQVYVAPVGTVGPTTATAPLDVAWKDLGFLTEDGVEFDPGIDLNEIMAWQAQYAVRKDIVGRTLNLGFTMLQWNEQTLPFALGGAKVVAVTAGTPAVTTFTLTPSADGATDQRAMLVEWRDGTKNYRLHVIKGTVDDLGGFTLAKSDASGLEVTYSVQAETSAAPWVLITDDPAFAV